MTIGKEDGERMMRKNEKKVLWVGILCMIAFVIWTVLVKTVDVQPLGQNGTDIGFATFNCWFHKWTGTHMEIYTITDWLGLIPIFICMLFGGIGFVQLMQRKSLLKVDYDIIVLGIYYIIVIAGYLIFEIIPINYRPILIEGRIEVSYPSSTTLLVLCVMPTLMEQASRRIENLYVKRVINLFVIYFSAFMVIGRLISGVHWFTDIVGAMLFSTGLFCIYKVCVTYDFTKSHHAI